VASLKIVNQDHKWQVKNYLINHQAWTLGESKDGWWFAWVK